MERESLDEIVNSLKSSLVEYYGSQDLEKAGEYLKKIERVDPDWYRMIDAEEGLRRRSVATK